MKPEIICYMMSSLDGRIDCDMTERIEGGDDYYRILEGLDFDATLSGKVTALLHYARGNNFSPKENKPVMTRRVHQAREAEHYLIITDRTGTLEWERNEIDGAALVIALSGKTNEEYLSYLESKGISYIVTGQDEIDLNGLVNILAERFSVRRLGVTGGGKIDASFLDAGLLDEIDVLIGPGIDGRTGQPALFDGRKKDAGPVNLLLRDHEAFTDGSLLLKYTVKRG